MSAVSCRRIAASVRVPARICTARIIGKQCSIGHFADSSALIDAVSSLKLPDGVFGLRSECSVTRVDLPASQIAELDQTILMPTIVVACGLFLTAVFLLGYGVLT